eukprot:718009-Amphidinium_carterae.1
MLQAACCHCSLNGSAPVYRAHVCNFKQTLSLLIAKFITMDCDVPFYAINLAWGLVSTLRTVLPTCKEAVQDGQCNF